MSKETGYPVMRYKPSSHPNGYESKKVHSSAEAESLGSEWSTHPEHFGACLAKEAGPELEVVMAEEAVKPAPAEELQAKKTRAPKAKESA